MIRLPSLFKPYDAYVSCDPAFKQAPEDPPESASELEKEAHVKAAVEYATQVWTCHDSGDWSSLLLPGQTPLKFVLQHVDRITLYALIDRVALPETNPRHIGDRLKNALLLRLALVDVIGADGVKIKREPDPEWDGWVMAQPEIVHVLDAADRRIVPELGLAIKRRAMHNPKS